MTISYFRTTMAFSALICVIPAHAAPEENNIFLHNALGQKLKIALIWGVSCGVSGLALKNSPNPVLSRLATACALSTGINLLSMLLPSDSLISTEITWIKSKPQYTMKRLKEAVQSPYQLPVAKAILSMISLSSIEKDPQARKTLETPLLIIALQNGNFEGARLLLAHGTNMHVTDKNGNTPLILATQSKQGLPDIALIKVLLQCGANVNAKNNDGITPLLAAVKPNPNLGTRLKEQDRLIRKEIITLLYDNNAITPTAEEVKRAGISDKDMQTIDYEGYYSRPDCKDAIQSFVVSYTPAQDLEMEIVGFMHGQRAAKDEVQNRKHKHSEMLEALQTMTPHEEIGLE